MKKRINWKQLLILIAIPLAVGGLAALLTGKSMGSYEGLQKPPLSPPPILFPIVWTALYILMGISAYLVYTAPAAQSVRTRGLLVWGLQLFFNFLWPLLFFKLAAYAVSFFWLLALLALVAAMIFAFRKASHTAAWLQSPYLLWGIFAAYLNLGVWALNG